MFKIDYFIKVLLSSSSESLIPGASGTRKNLIPFLPGQQFYQLREISVKQRLFWHCGAS
jgi:hypothetical protein